jgi:hypothetical protein
MSVAEQQSILNLEQPSELAFVRGEWVAERIGWLVGALLLTAAVLGAFGQGGFGWRSVASSDRSLLVEYDAIDRYQADSKLRLVLPPGTPLPVRIRIGRDFLNDTTPVALWPPPSKVESRDGALECTFEFGSEGPHEIVYRYQHETYGPLKYQVSVEGSEPVTVSQFVFP